MWGAAAVEICLRGKLQKTKIGRMSPAESSHQPEMAAGLKGRAKTDMQG